MADRARRVTTVRRRVAALALVAAVRLVLWWVPYRSARRWFDRAPGPDAVVDLRRARAIANEVRRASRLVPRASCFTQALAARTWLARRGLANELRIGVARKPDGSPEAHAWIEVAGQVVLGDVPDLARFGRLDVPGTAPARTSQRS
jgi:hypothetical protein